jgi:hypothetical protein
MQLAVESGTLDTSDRIVPIPKKEAPSMTNFGGSEIEISFGGGEAERAFGGGELEVGVGVSA